MPEPELPDTEMHETVPAIADNNEGANGRSPQTHQPATSVYSTPAGSTLIGKLGFLWGLGGFLLLLLFAVYRLAPIAWEALQQPLQPLHYLVFIVNTLFMAYSEGYKGFQKAYTPRVVARAWHILENPRLRLVLLAPLFCMAYFNAPRKRIMTSWILTFAIIVLVIIFQKLPQPWRGILDAGVVVGLSWGIVATVLLAIRKMAGETMDLNPELARSSQ